MTRSFPSTRSTAWHEAFHAAALCLAGLVPECVRVDWPEADLAGCVILDWGPDGPDADKGRSVLVAIMLGDMTAGERWEDFPPK